MPTRSEERKEKQEFDNRMNELTRDAYELAEEYESELKRGVSILELECPYETVIDMLKKAEKALFKRTDVHYSGEPERNYENYATWFAQVSHRREEFEKKLESYVELRKRLEN
ncbi:MAG: hypothetical protein ACFFCS_09795 [Candidatus Hodarchaeota archaeon]